MRKRKKATRKIAILVAGILTIILIYMAALLVDSFNDIEVCKNEFISKAPFSGIGEWQFNDAFANDDMFILNLGNDIHCTVFWKGNTNVFGYPEEMNAYIEFKSGTLTTQMINQSKYWSD